jgi:ribosomal protein S18 acetylase RimI-like enzyme
MVAIRSWEPRDRGHIQWLLSQLSGHVSVIDSAAPTFVAELEGQVVGMVTLCVFTTLTGPKAYLDHLVVSHDRRRQGIGRALVEFAIERARDAGASRIDLTANEHKHAGRALYESLGFERRNTGVFRLNFA